MQEASSFQIIQAHTQQFNQDIHDHAHYFLGVKKLNNSHQGFQFSVWAPRAWQVFLQGDFSSWKLLPMQRIDGGVWTLFVPEANEGDCYKYGIDHGNGHIEYKIDPYALKFETPPKDASIIEDRHSYQWQDQEWLNQRAQRDKYASPLQIYEVHLTSWRKHPDGRAYHFKELAQALIPYVKEMGYSHIEFMPVMAHPLDASWGYQVMGYFAVAAQYGSNDDLKYFIDQAHQSGIGVILDWVPGHFNRNANGLAYYDGHPCYEYESTIKAENRGWGCLNFDLGKNQVKSFLLSNLRYWLEDFHVDGIRVDAVSNMLYLDFDEGPWQPNPLGGNENLEGFEFLRLLNRWVQDHFPDVYMIAEESHSQEGITRSLSEQGLGFDYKWNLGWMNDILRFFQLPPDQRSRQLRLVTFVYVYQFKERYILPLSHDEVVHGKRSLLGKMPGNRFDQFANLRLLHAYMLTQPGKKLHFMGNELGQFLEWRFYEELDWPGLNRAFNLDYQACIREINQRGLQRPEFFQEDHSWQGMTVLDADDLERGLLIYIRWSAKRDSYSIVIINFTSNHYHQVKVGVPFKGNYCVYFNSQSSHYGGYVSNGNPKYEAVQEAYQGQDFSCMIEVPALSLQLMTDTINYQ